MKAESIAETVHAILLDSLFKDEEITNGKPPDPHIEARGIVNNFAFHPERLESHRENIRAILNLMPKGFHKATGGGWSFLNLCNTEAGDQWGEHHNMEELIVLGIGLGMAKFVMPRDMWTILPGGMPYVVFDAVRPLAQTGEGKP